MGPANDSGAPSAERVDRPVNRAKMLGPRDGGVTVATGSKQRREGDNGGRHHAETYRRLGESRTGRLRASYWECCRNATNAAGSRVSPANVAIVCPSGATTA